MAGNPADELAQGIARSVVPFNAGQDIYGVYGPSENFGMKLFRMLGILPGPKQKAPGLNEPLPRIDPRTGEIIWPEGKGPR